MRIRYFINYFLWISPWIILGIIVFIVAIVFFLKSSKKEWSMEEEELIKIDEFYNVTPLIERIEEYFELKSKISSFLDLKEILSEIRDISNNIIPVVFDEYLIFYLHEITDKINFLKKHLDDRKFTMEALMDLEEIFKKIREWYKGRNEEI